MELAFDALTPRASVTSAVKEKVPASVGVPPTVPPVVKDRPSGSAPPLSDHVYGVLPPVAPNDTPAYAIRSSPAWNDGELTTRVANVGEGVGCDVLGVLRGDVLGEVVGPVETVGRLVGVSPATGELSTVGDEDEDGLGTLPSGTRPHAVSSTAAKIAIREILFKGLAVVGDVHEQYELVRRARGGALCRVDQIDREVALVAGRIARDAAGRERDHAATSESDLPLWRWRGRHWITREGAVLGVADDDRFRRGTR